MAISDGKGAGSALIEAIATPKALVWSRPRSRFRASSLTLVLTIWAIAST